MSIAVRPYWLAVVLGFASLAEAQSHSKVILAAHGGHGHSGGSMQGGVSGGAIQGGVPGGFLASGINNHYGNRSNFGPGYAVGGSYGFGYGLGYGYGYSYGYSNPLVVNNFYSLGAPLLYPVPVPVNGGGGGLQLPMPPRQAANPTPAARHRNTNRSKELVEIGDRSFRGGNIKRAEEKYQAAAKADPTAPIPHVHMAQVSLARGDYVAAADHLRDAVTVAAEGGWLLTAPDIQAIFAEPADFARHLARLESHLQANPNDRDAWFVLGAECYLSGRTKQSSDVFERLTDRKADEALAAFMDASKTKMPAAVN